MTLIRYSSFFYFQSVIFFLISKSLITMPTINETGHAKNVANFQDLISFCSGYPAYNPTATALSVANLTTKLTDVRTALNGVIVAQTTYNNAVNARMMAFDGLKALSTRIVNAFDASGANAEAVKDAKTLNRKLQGKRATPKQSAIEQSNGTTPPSENSISVSQLSYDQQIEHLSRLISLLTTSAVYSPNEAELTTASLQTKLSSLVAANTAVINAYTNYSNSLIARNDELYNAVTGLVNTAAYTKKYIKSVFGASSPQYRQVSGLLFKPYK